MPNIIEIRDLNKTFKISGPETFVLTEIVELVAAVLNVPVRIKKMPVWLGRCMFSAIALATGNPAAKDFLYRMTRDSTCTDEDMRQVRDAFSIEFERLEPWLRRRLTA